MEEKQDHMTQEVSVRFRQCCDLIHRELGTLIYIYNHIHILVLVFRNYSGYVSQTIANDCRAYLLQHSKARPNACLPDDSQDFSHCQ